jgi:hypothetical protein
VATVEDVGDVVDALGPRRGVARGGPEVDVPEPRGDLVNGHAGLEQTGGPVGAERVRVGQALGHPGGQAAAAHQPVDGHSGEGERLLIAVAAQPHKEWLLVEQPNAARKRMHRRPRFESVLYRLGDRHFAFTPYLAAHI